MLRSSNRVSVNVPSTSQSFRMVSVVYDGPVITGGLLVCRVQMRSLTASGATAFRAGVAVVRVGYVTVSQAFIVTPTAIGQTCEVGWSQLVDLVPGDQIELNMGTAGSNVWELDPFGFSVDIR